jgi:phospholipase C
MRHFTPTLVLEILIAGLLVSPATSSAQTPAPTEGTTTPIKHLVVIFQENVSFDHYFATDPYAANPEGEPAFFPLPNTPSVNGLSGALMTNNPNALNTLNGAGATNPFRLSRAQAATADMDHDYTPEQMAFHGGLMDLFPMATGTPGPPPSGSPIFSTTGLVMGYFDGSTVTALWNYAQRYAMSDNSYGTTFGPSTVGAVNLISGQTNGVIGNLNGTGALADDGSGGLTDIGDADPAGDVCSTSTGEVFSLSGTNIGDLLNAAGVSWGFFEGGFDLTKTNPNGTTGCSRSTTSLITASKKADYIPHHQPFQYYKSTANPTHARPTSVSTIGQAGDAGNHQYDINDFFTAVQAGNFPAVSFLKAPGYQDGHAGYSDPLDEQEFIVNTINFLQTQGSWSQTAVVIAYDDSDGWYDHQLGPLMNQSTSAADAISGTGACGSGTTALPGVASGTVNAQGRCGYGPRLPFMVISPWAKSNFVDHSVTDQTSVLRFIEDNWLNGQRIGGGSFDALANSLGSMLNFTAMGNAGIYELDPGSGLVVSETGGTPSANVRLSPTRIRLFGKP